MFCDLLHRTDLAPHGAGAPAIDKLHRPLRARVLPEPLEVLAEQMSSDALKVVLQDLLEPDLLMLREVFLQLEQAPPGFSSESALSRSAAIGRPRVLVQHCF